MLSFHPENSPSLTTISSGFRYFKIFIVESISHISPFSPPPLTSGDPSRLLPPPALGLQHVGFLNRLKKSDSLHFSAPLTLLRPIFQDPDHGHIFSESLHD